MITTLVNLFPTSTPAVIILDTPYLYTLKQGKLYEPSAFSFYYNGFSAKLVYKINYQPFVL
jgi:hypothetical protein